MTASMATAPARDRLLATATQQFFQYGYRGVGIDRIIRESGIAKATFYAHFASKEALYTEVLKSTSQGALAYLETRINRCRTLQERLLAPLDSLLQILPDKGFRGCPFINMTAEIHDPGSEARRLGEQHYRGIRNRVETMAIELAESDPQNHAHLAQPSFVDQYMTAYTGAIALSTLWQDAGPIRSARELVLQLVKPRL